MNNEIWVVELERFYEEIGRPSKLRIEQEYEDENYAREAYRDIKLKEGKTYWEKKRIGTAYINEHGNLEIDDWERIEFFDELEETA